MSTPKSQPTNIPQSGMKEEEAFRRAQVDPAFRAFILAEWLKSKKKAQIFVATAITLFIGTTIYSGFMYARWSPNLFWAALVIAALWTHSTANTTIAALRAIGEKPNQSAQPPQASGLSG